MTSMGYMEKMSNNLPQTTGIDISKARLDCHAHPQGLSVSLPTPPWATRR
jgi:hypothetical protein